MMKRKNVMTRFALLVISILALGISGAAQETKISQKDVPAAVMVAFKSAYPNATVRGYAREKENGKVFYEIESTDGSTLRDLSYNPDGSLATMEETIPAADLPSAAQQTIHTKYPRAVVTRVEKVTEGAKVTYEVSAKQGTKRISMEFDAAGKALKNKIK